MEVLGSEEVRRRIPAALARVAIARAFSAIARGDLHGPVRTALSTDEGPTLIMPAVSQRMLGLKVLHIREENPANGLPSIVGQFLLYRRDTGEPVACLDGSELTGIRTAALAGHASSLLAPMGASIGAVLGAGHQGFYQAIALAEALPLREIRVWNRTETRAQRLAERLRPLLPDVTLRVAPSVREAVQGASVVTAATASTSPLLRLQDLAESVHLNLMGAYRPDMCEATAEVIGAASRVVVDSEDGCRVEAGDLLQAAERGLFDLGKVRTLAKPVAERHGITVFKSVGAAVFDLAVAQTLFEEPAPADC